MSNTYTQIYIHLVFAVNGKPCLISKPLGEELQKYITGILQNRGHKMLAINCMPDHTHILVGLNPSRSVSDLARDAKAVSSKFINEKRRLSVKFSWQEGYGAFSHSRSQLDSAVKYILNQDQHHRKKSFKEEYLEFLKKFEIEYDEKYLFEWIE